MSAYLASFNDPLTCAGSTVKPSRHSKEYVIQMFGSMAGRSMIEGSARRTACEEVGSPVRSVVLIEALM